ncbi:MAG: MFS transporter, partial [Pyrinomonadaceae bacterium]
IVQNSMSAEAFGSWGWRVPFLISIFLVGMSLYIRLRMKESPIFEHIKSTGMASAKPIVDAFMNPANRKRVLISLLGATAGQGVVWYTGQFYALFYMQTILKIEKQTASLIIAAAILLAIPFFIFFGWLSDKIGRKKIMMAGCLLAVIFYLPVYRSMVSFSRTRVESIQSTPDKITGEPKLQPVAYEKDSLTPTVSKLVPVTEANPNVPMLILCVFVQMLFVTMVYAPIAAYLVEAFPAKIRYTSMSLPYHIGNGVFGGLLPTIGLLACAWTGNIYAGLYYPMIVAGITFVIGSIFLRETHRTRLWDEFDKNDEV